VKCRDINHLLDTDTPEELTRAQGVTIDIHLASCRACREEMANWNDFAALPIPLTPASLMARIEAALPANEPIAARRSLRPFVIGGVLVAGAAAAAIALQFAGGEPASSLPVPASRGVTHGEERGAAEEVAQLLPADAMALANPDEDANTDLDPRKLIVLRRPEATADGQALAFLEQCHDALVNRLRTVDGLSVIVEPAVLTSASPMVRFRLSDADRDIARARGAGKVLIVTSENGCAATQFDVQRGNMMTGAMNGRRLPPDDGWNSLANSLVQGMLAVPAGNPVLTVAEARRALLNASLSEAERMQALINLRLNGLSQDGNQSGGVFDGDVVAAAVQLGSKSADASIRGSMWASLRQVDDPQLIQPLLHALANDPDASVRMQAALSLNTFLDRPGVREALQRAAVEDPAGAPTVICCILTVREAAERASIPDAEMRNWVRGRLLDENLPARSRLLPLVNGTPDGRVAGLSIDQFGGDAQRVAFDIGRREQDPRVRQMAWDVLARAAPDDAFVPVLLGDMSSHPDEFVRGAAAQVLRNYVHSANVREAFERALNDPSMQVRRIAASVLQR
jgi:HEAT repeat protein